MLGFLWAILIGLFVGLVARLFMPGPTVKGFIMTSLLGIGGSVVGRWVGQAFGWYGPQDPTGFFMSVLGALLILFVYRLAQSVSREL